MNYANTNTLKPIQKLKCKDFYCKIIEHQHDTTAAKTKWIEVYPTLKHVDETLWNRIFIMPFETT